MIKLDTIKQTLEYHIDYHYKPVWDGTEENLRDLGIPLNTDSTIKGQIIFLAERTAELMNENVITDRDTDTRYYSA